MYIVERISRVHNFTIHVYVNKFKKAYFYE